jgi:hypothetical protein
MTIYRDPSASGYPHPRLFVDLLARPSKVDLLPLELQVTAILAWLLDRSRPFALALLDAFVGLECDVGERVIGARTQIGLPPIPPGGWLYPDLSIDVADGALQLLVEVKVDASFHTHVLDSGTYLQPDTYVLAWEHAAGLDGRDEAEMRRVGTLSRSPANAPKLDAKLEDADTRRGADISWHTVRDLIADGVSAGAFGELRGIASEFSDVVEERILSSASGTAISDPTLAWGWGLLADVLPAVVGRIPGASLGPSVAPQLDYVGRYLRLDFGLASPVQLWIYVSTALGRYNGGRAEANLWLSERPDALFPPDVRRQLATAGFSEVTDLAGSALRRSFSVDRILASVAGDSDREIVIEWILRSLTQAGALVGPVEG